MLIIDAGAGFITLKMGKKLSKVKHVLDKSFGRERRL